MVANTLSTSIKDATRHAGWAMALRGVIAVVFGIIALRSPSLAMSAFVIAFAIYAFADGILDFVLAGRLGRAGQRWGWFLFEGIVSCGLGVIALASPALTMVAVVLLVAIRAIVLGTLEVVGAIMWKMFDARWLLGLTGVLSVIFGVLLLAQPGVGALALTWTVGVYAIALGAMLLALGLRVLYVGRHEGEIVPPHTPVEA